MKEGVLDILIYLFENYFDGDLDQGDEPDRDTLKQELERAGFAPGDVERALCWLEDVAADPSRSGPAPTGRAIRVFGALEQARLDTDCRGFLVHLENVGILSPTQRELVIDRNHLAVVIEIGLILLNENPAVIFLVVALIPEVPVQHIIRLR